MLRKLTCLLVLVSSWQVVANDSATGLRSIYDLSLKELIIVSVLNRHQRGEIKLLALDPNFLAHIKMRPTLN